MCAMSENHKRKTKKDKKRNSFITNSYGEIKGPVHTGSGSITIGSLNYGTDQHKLTLLQNDLLSRLEASQYPSIIPIVKQLQFGQLEELRKLCTLLESVYLSSQEVKLLLANLRPIIESAQQRSIFPLTQIGTEVSPIEIIDSPSLDVVHKLKLTLPIIPFLLNYEGEFGVDNKVDLETVYNWLRSKLGRNPKRSRQ